MKFTVVLPLLLLLNFLDSFKADQLRYSRVRNAYQEKEAGMLKILGDHELVTDGLRVYLRAFKSEKKIELWARNTNDATFKLIKTYAVCQLSGKLGPKRQRGDLQIPEGFYHIDRFNPSSNFHLSLGINYPNKSDRILGKKNSLGGDIFIHGDCVTIGCLPITDEQIKELYIFCVEAKDQGQSTIPVTIFPSELQGVHYDKLMQEYDSDQDKLNLWTDLKSAYDYFEEHEKLPNVSFLKNGRHKVE